MVDQAKRAGFFPTIDLTSSHVPGIRFRATWHFENSGDTNWQANYQFAFCQTTHPETAGIPNIPLGTTISYPLKELGAETPIVPNQIIGLTLHFTAPKKAGTYATNWQLQNALGEFFGPVRWLRILITDKSYDAQMVTETTESVTDVEAGKQFITRWRMTNTGNLRWTEDFNLVWVNAGIQSTKSSPLSPKTSYPLWQVASHTPVLPKETIIIQLPIHAPKKAGNYHTNWQLQTEKGRNFGPMNETKIDVIPTKTTPKIGMNVGHFEETWRVSDLEDLRELLTPFPIIRFMDWQKTNSLFAGDVNPSNYEPIGELILSSRPQPNDDWRYAGKGAWHTFAGVPLEIIVDFANQLSAQPWICIPHLATDELLDEMVSYVLTHAQQRPIFEYSNEVWNSGFKQFYDCAELGKPIVSEGRLATLGVNLTGFRSPAELRRAIARGRALVWQADRTKFLASRVKTIASDISVLNKSNGADVIICSQYAVPWSSEFLLKVCGDLVTAVGIAPYLGNTLKDAESEEAIFSALYDELGDPQAEEKGGAFTMAGRVAEHQLYAGKYNLPVWGYEGGLHLRGSQFADFNRSTAAGAILGYFLDNWTALNDGLICLYSLTSRFGNEQFGHVELTGSPSAFQFQPLAKYKTLIKYGEG